ncbi:MAG: hypothetical protein ACRECH_16060 [Nitrososphaerales archaeon]
MLIWKVRDEAKCSAGKKSSAAFYLGLKRNGLFESQGKNRWAITRLVRNALRTQVNIDEHKVNGIFQGEENNWRRAKISV